MELQTTKYQGFIADIETREAVCDSVAAREGAEPFRVTIQTGLTFRQLQAIPLRGDSTWEELHKAIYRYVLDWNALWLNPESGEYERLIPPAQAGPGQFEAINNNLVAWLGWELKIGHLRGRDLPKEQPPSSDTPALSNEGGDISQPPTPPRPSRRNRTTTT